MSLFKGSGVALVTPFYNDKIDYESMYKLIDYVIDNGTDAIIVCGTTGEASTLSYDEQIECIKKCVEYVDGRVCVIAGTGSNCTKSAVNLSMTAEKLGVDGWLVVTPYYNKCTQNGLIEHYKEIAKNVNLPIIIYSVPGRTGVNIEPKTCLELSKIDNIVAIKEASGNLSQVAEIAHLCGDNLNIYSGNDDQIIPILSIGGIGVISVLSNIKPKYTHQMCEEFFNKNTEKAAQMQINAIPLINALFSEVNPIPVKEALNIIGYNYGVPRLPLIRLSEENKKILIKNIEELN